MKSKLMIYSWSMNTAVYIHIPFCAQRCSYCDFNTYAGLDNLIPAYVQAVCQEIEMVGQSLPSSYSKKFHTVYFGGGTPSLLSPEDIQKILIALERNLGFDENVEISLEANPGTLSLEKMKAYVDIGINRLSLGFQSANEHELRLLGRIHTLDDVLKSVEFARLAGLRNLNLDLIYGLPGQSLAEWRHTLQVALSLDVEHLSLYSLTIEEGTSLNAQILQGQLPYPDSDFAADCYELARERLASCGYLHYEISNWAKKRSGEEIYFCRHNLQYWKNREYFGFGAGAHGFVNGFRLVNALHPSTYIEKMILAQSYPFPLSAATVIAHPINREEEMRDTVLLGLRLVEQGVGDLEFAQRFGKTLTQAFPREIHRLLRKRLVEWIETDQRRLRLTRFGQLLGNQAFIEFV